MVFRFFMLGSALEGLLVNQAIAQMKQVIMNVYYVVGGLSSLKIGNQQVDNWWLIGFLTSLFVGFRSLIESEAIPFVASRAPSTTLPLLGVDDAEQCRVKVSMCSTDFRCFWYLLNVSKVKLHNQQCLTSFPGLNKSSKSWSRNKRLPR